jgi:2-polyprenyl-3-methyl-5-hydroxy-6-metoxy-1,4-benzoquinol methylase
MDGYSNYLNQKDSLIARGKKYARLINRYAPKGTVLDVGAACGFILKGFEMEGWDGTGIEPNEEMVSYGKTHFHQNLVPTSLEEFRSTHTFDLITMIQVIGHFYDFDKSLDNIARHVKPQGLVLIESWERSSLPARLLGKKWHEYNPPSVLQWFSKKTLTAALGQHGFEPVAFGRPQKKISFRHLLSYLQYRSSNKALKSALNKLASSKFTRFHVLYPPLDIFWALYRKKA